MSGYMGLHGPAPGATTIELRFYQHCPAYINYNDSTHGEAWQQHTGCRSFHSRAPLLSVTQSLDTSSLEGLHICFSNLLSMSNCLRRSDRADLTVIAPAEKRLKRMSPLGLVRACALHKHRISSSAESLFQVHSHPCGPISMHSAAD